MVAGYMTEYSGFRWALYFLAEVHEHGRGGVNCHDAISGRVASPFSGIRALISWIFLPSLLDAGVAGYCFYRAPKQPVKITNKWFLRRSESRLFWLRLFWRRRLRARGFDARKCEGGIARRVLVPAESRALSVSVHCG